MSTWVHITNANNSARFLLGQTGNKTLVFIGINPSTASPEKLDPTVTRMRNFARDLGYDGWMVVNVYPQRATNPANIHKRLNRKLHEDNCQQLQKWSAKNQFDICACWGVEIERRPFLHECLPDLISSFGDGAKWLQLGESTKAGHPRHPLYLKKDTKLSEFKMNLF